MANPQRASRRPVLVIGVSGSSASYKICNLIRIMRKTTDMRVIMTRSATEFITPKMFQVLTGNPVLVSLFDDRHPGIHPHVDLSTELDAFLVAPATADMIGKMANGIADDALSTLALSVSPSTKPCFVAPTMMPRMWGHPIVEANVARLQEVGYRIIRPGEGRHADGLQGPGRLAEPERIAEQLRDVLPLAGQS